MANSTPIPTPQATAIALDAMSSRVPIIAGLSLYALDVSAAANATAAEKSALALLVQSFTPRAQGTPEARAFGLTRAVINALTPGRIGQLGDTEEELQAAWSEVHRRQGFYLGTAPRSFGQSVAAAKLLGAYPQYRRGAVAV